jgi:4-amino-4-deoxy-L-arabinose transferase-like glycosyltransferase
VRAVVVVLVAYALAARLFVAWSLPPWQGPDEPKHFEFARLLIDKRAEFWRERRLPRQFGDNEPGLQRAVIESLYRNHWWLFANVREPATPPTSFDEIWGGAANELGRTFEPLPYLAALALLPFDDWGVDDQLRILRTLVAVLSGASVFVSYLVAREIAPEDPFVPVVAAGLVAVLPMHIFMGGVFNPDGPASLIGSLVLLGLLRGLRTSFSRRTIAFVGFGLLAGVLAKRTGFAFLPVVFIAWAGSIRARPGRRVTLVGAGVALVVAASAFLLWAGPPPFDRVGAHLNHYFLNEPDQITRVFDGRLADPRTLALTSLYVEMLHNSFWGIFGWFSSRLPEIDYAVLSVFVRLAVLGLAVNTWRALRREGYLCRRRIAAASIPAVLVMTLIAMAILQELSYFQPGRLPQGRYLFIGVAAIAALLALGWRAFLPAKKTGVWGPTAVFLGLLFLLDCLALTQTYLPYYLSRAIG